MSVGRPRKMELISGIYCIKCIPTGKVYIGSTSNWPKRYRQHRWELNKGISRLRHLQAAWTKYGEESFEIGILEETTPDREILIQREKFYIDKFDSCNSDVGLNCRLIPNSNLGVKFSEDFKARCRLRRPTEDTRKKMSESHKGQKPSELNKLKRSEALKGKPLSQETREKISKAHMGKVVSAETRERISIASKKAWAIKKNLDI